MEMDKEESVQFLDVERARTEAFAYAAPIRPYATSISELAIDQTVETEAAPSQEEVARAYADYVARVSMLNIYNRREAMKSHFARTV